MRDYHFMDWAISQHLTLPNRLDQRIGLSHSPARPAVDGDSNMKKIILTLLPLCTLGGCANLNHTENGALIGGGVGAGTGALIGSATGHPGVGAAIGAGVGAVTGGLI